MRDGLFTRPYLTYIDANGMAHKAVALPQEDPTYYDSCLNTYPVPELVAGPVQPQESEWVAAARSTRAISAALPLTSASPKAAPVEASWKTNHE